MSETRLLSVEEAQASALALARPMPRERVALPEALGRVLGEPVHAPGDVPPEDNSAMDGYAVRAADLATASELTVAGEVRAGQVAARPLEPGQAYAITTGAPIPPGADAVVMVEDTERSPSGERVRIGRAPQAGQHVRRRGEDLRAGDEVLPAGVTLGPAEIGVLAAARRSTVLVARRPEVAILATGDELRELDQPLGPGTIADTNSWTLAALVRAAGGRPRLSAIVRDDPRLLEAAITEALSADLIVSSGGVSVGEHDYVKPVLAKLGARLDLWRVNMKPGKPVAIAEVPWGNRAVPYFGLPGNPVSTVIAFLLFVRPALRAQLGCAQPIDLPALEVVLDGPLRSRGERVSFVRARAHAGPDGQLHALAAGKQGSHVLSSLAGCNALLVLPPGTHDLPPGARARALLIGPLVG